MSGDWNGAADEEEERWTVQLRMQQTAEYSAGNSYKVEERRNQQEKIATVNQLLFLKEQKLFLVGTSLLLEQNPSRKEVQ